MPPSDYPPPAPSSAFNIEALRAILFDVVLEADPVGTATGARALRELLAEAMRLDPASRSQSPSDDYDDPDEGPPFVMPPPMTLEEWLAAFAPRNDSPSP